MNRARCCKLEHFNKSNALGWALTMGLFAMPVVYSETRVEPDGGESYYIQLGPEDRFGLGGAGGKSFIRSRRTNLVQMKDEIYRVCYLNNQAMGRSVELGQSIGAGQTTGLRDHRRSAGGVWDNGAGKHEAGAVGGGGARQDEVSIDVAGNGSNSTSNAFSTELDEAQKLLNLGIHSPHPDQADLQAAGIPIPGRCKAGSEEPSGGRDRRGGGVGWREARADFLGRARMAAGSNLRGSSGIGVYGRNRRYKRWCGRRSRKFVNNNSQGRAGAQGGVAGRATAAGNNWSAASTSCGGGEQTEPESGGGGGARIGSAGELQRLGVAKGGASLQSGAGRDRAERGREAG